MQRFCFDFCKCHLFYCLSQIMVVAWTIGCCIIGINIYFLSTSFGGWLIHNSLPKVASIFIGLVVFPLMALYLAAILYLVFRRDRKVTFIAPGDSLVHIPSDPERELEILANH